VIKILQIVNRVPWPLKDGGALGYYNYIKGYHDAGCDVTVAALNTSKHFVNSNELPDELKNLADWRFSYIDNKVKPLDAFINLFSNKSYNIERFVSDDFKKQLNELLHEKQFDVIVFESLFVAPYIDVVTNNSNALLVLRQHNVEHKIWETLAQEEPNPIKKIYLNLLASRLKKFETTQLNKFDALTTVTQNDANYFKQMGCNQPVFSSPTGIDISRLKVDDSTLEIPSVFHIGSMEWMPNQQAVMWFIKNVWNRILVKYPSLKLVIAGRGMTDSFKQQNFQNVEMKGEVDDAVKFIQSKQIMIVPLFAGSGIRVKILEGMAMGKAIVSTSLGAQGIEAENGKHLLIANTAEEFTEAIFSLVSNAKFADELGRNARKLVESTYDNTKVIDRLLKFYEHQIQNKANF